MKEKKAIRIPRLAVYCAAFFASVVVCLLFGLAFGFDYALEFATNALVLTAIALTAYNVFEKIDEQPWRLTPKYWGLVALILVTDFLFMYFAKAPDKTSGMIRGLIFMVSAIVLGGYTFFVYKPAQEKLTSDVKKKIKEAVTAYISAHLGETPDKIADELVEIVFAPKERIMTEEKSGGEEENA